MNWLTLLVIAVLVLWWVKPLRDFLVQRTNRTVKVLLVVFPALFLARLAYAVYNGEQGDWLIGLLTVSILLLLWLGLVWLGNVLERRRPTQARAPDLAALSRIPGMPRIPQAATSPELQQAARMATEAAARVDWNNVAGDVGRISGRLFARARKSMAADPPPASQRPSAPPS
jgi:hypothetical protein